MASFTHIFILSTGRCGSMSIVEACRFMENYTAAHESRCRMIGDERLNYPSYHIESDNRLSWMLGRLDERYGDKAFYVHLRRDRMATATSFTKRWGPFSIMKGYSEGILMSKDKSLDVCLDYYDTVTSNISSFLKDKTHTMTIHLEEMKTGFENLWEAIDAKGDLDLALQSFDTPQNTSQERGSLKSTLNRKLFTLKHKIRDAID